MKLARLAVGLSLVASVLAGCADENAPKTWVKRLDDPAKRAAAVERLGRFWDVALTKAHGDRDDAQVRALADAIAEPLAKTYGAAGLDAATRAALMKELAAIRDPRTAPALAKSLAACEAGKTDEETRFAAQAVTGLAAAKKLPDGAVVDALWSCFDKFQAHAAKSQDVALALRDALVAVKSPSYEPKAIAKLAAPVDARDPEAAKDQLAFWQPTAAQVLVALRSVDGVHAVVVALLTPPKAPMREALDRALLAAPQESETALVAALRGKDPELAKLAADLAPPKEQLVILAASLAGLSRPIGRDAVIDALASTTDDDVRVGLARWLVAWPEDPRILPMFMDTYRKVAPPQRAALIPAATQLYDPTLVDWLLAEVAAAKGEVQDEMRRKGLQAAIDSMAPAEMQAVAAALAKYGTPPEQDRFRTESEVLTKCNTDARCYVAAIDGSASPVKAAHMAVVFGRADANARADLVARIGKGSVPGVMLDAIDRLWPRGDATVADRLEAAGDDGAREEALRLRARAL
jgi:hypothetical protein